MGQGTEQKSLSHPKLGQGQLCPTFFQVLSHLQKHQKVLMA